jgi:hypothetical protein
MVIPFPLTRGERENTCLRWILARSGSLKAAFRFSLLAGLHFEKSRLI